MRILTDYPLGTNPLFLVSTMCIRQRVSGYGRQQLQNTVGRQEKYFRNSLQKGVVTLGNALLTYPLTRDRVSQQWAGKFASAVKTKHDASLFPTRSWACFQAQNLPKAIPNWVRYRNPIRQVMPVEASVPKASQPRKVMNKARSLI